MTTKHALRTTRISLSCSCDSHCDMEELYYYLFNSCYVTLYVINFVRKINIFYEPLHRKNIDPDVIPDKGVIGQDGMVFTILNNEPFGI